MDIERYRCAGASYWLTIVPPRAGSDSPNLPPLLKREAKLLGQLEAARFVRMTPILPPYYRRFGYDLRDVLRKPPRCYPAADAGHSGPLRSPGSGSRVDRGPGLQ